jgi:hypothetical protein
MFFGMCNAPASFQQMADTILQPLIDQGCIFVYVDNVLIVGDTLQELDYWMWEVLTVMRDANLSCKPVKCQFERTTVKYLGTYLTQGQIAVNPAKVTAINEWPVPQKLKDIESFLSTINFWQKFIKDFSAITHLLHELKKKDVPFEWTKACQDVFDALKRALVTAPILKILWENLPYLLETDTSGFMLGAVLSQCHDGKWYPIDFHSQSLIPAE